MRAHNNTGKNQARGQRFRSNTQQGQALLLTPLQGRDPNRYQKLCGQRHVRDVWQRPTRGVSGKNVVMPFYN